MRSTVLSSRASRLLLWLLIVIPAVLLCSARLQSPWLNTDLLAMLPDDPLPSSARSLARQQQQNFSERLIWLVPGADPSAAAEATHQLRQRLATHQLVRSIGPALNPEQLERRYRALRAYRFQLVTVSDRQALKYQPHTLIDNAHARLFGPLGVSGKQWQGDPLFLFERYLSALMPLSLDANNGILVLEDAGRYWGLSLVDLEHTGFSLSQQEPLLRMTRDLQRHWPESLVTGVPLFMAAGAEGAREEIGTVGMFSLAAVVVLFLSVFGGPRPMALAILSVGTGILCGLTATLLAFDQIQLLSLVFGASLIGVAADYSIHFFCHRLGKSDVDPWRLWRSMAGPLTLALISSVLGYLAMGLAAFPGLRQVALFSAAGLIGAWLTVMLVLPGLIGQAASTPRPRLLALAGAWRTRWPTWYRRHRKPATLLVVLLLASGLAHLTADDDMRHYQSPPPWLMSQSDRIQAMLPAGDSRYFVVHGADLEQWWQREQALAGRLRDISGKAGHLGGFRAISDLWQPPARQNATRKEIRHLYQSSDFEDFLTSLGLDQSAVAEQRRALDEAATAAIDLPAWLDVIDDPGLRDQWGGCNAEGCTSLIRLTDVKAPTELAALAAPDQGRFFVDRASAINTILTAMRHHLMLLLLGAYLISGLVLALSRGPVNSLRLLGVPALASLTALSVLGWIQGEYGLISILALFLLLGIGIDYAIFFIQPGPGPRKDAAALAILLAAATTALSFGLLSLSATRLVADFGLTMLIGCLVAALIAPLLAAGGTDDNPGGARHET